MIPDGEMPRPNAHHVVKGELDNESAFGVDLGEHGLAVQGHHGALITVHGDAGVVKGFFGVAKLVAKVGHAALEVAAEVARDQSAAYAYKEKGKCF